MFEQQVNAHNMKVPSEQDVWKKKGKMSKTHLIVAWTTFNHGDCGDCRLGLYKLAVVQWFLFFQVLVNFVSTA